MSGNDARVRVVRRSVKLLLCCALGLILVPTGGAKRFELEICGASGCKAIPARASGPIMAAYGSWEISPLIAPAPFFVVTLTADGKEVGRLAYVPSARALWHRVSTWSAAGHGVSGTWSQLSAEDDVRWSRLPRGLRP
jgi:hypothetical protein